MKIKSKTNSLRSKETILKKKKLDGEEELLLKSFRIFDIEYNRLLKFYGGSVYSYTKTFSEMNQGLEAGILTYEEAVTLESPENNSFSVGRLGELRRRLRDQYPPILKELTFIRMISALEIFLIDSIKEVFLNDRRIFKFEQTDNFQITNSELFSFEKIEDLLSKYISKETRNLQNQGYEVIKKFYLKKLDIDFSSLVSEDRNISNLISKYHEQRHLIVHRLGHTDEQYKHKYGVKYKKIIIGESYLMQALEDVKKLASFINKSLLQKLNPPKEATQQELFPEQV